MKFLIYLILSFVTGFKCQDPISETGESILEALGSVNSLENFENDLKDLLLERIQKRKKDEFDVVPFLRSYAKYQKLQVPEKVLNALKKLETGLEVSSHLAKLTSVVDVVDEIVKNFGENSIEKIEEILKTEDSIPTIQHRLRDFSRTEFPVKTHSNSQVKKSSTNPTNDIVSSIVNFLKMVKSRPNQIFDLLIPTLDSYKLLSRGSLKTIDMYGRMLVQSVDFDTIADSLLSYVEDLGSSEFGKRFSKMVPGLMQAKDMNEISEVIYKETGMDIGNVLSQLQNSDIRQKLFNSASAFLVSFTDVFHQLIADDFKLALVNTFLLSQNFPAINSRNLLVSTSRVLEIFFQKFTSWDIDINQYQKNIQEHSQVFEDNYMAWSDFQTLSEEQKVNLIGQALNDNFGEPLELLWLAHDHVTAHKDGRKCAETILCHLNNRFKDNKGNFKKGVARGLSIFASWAWSLDGNLDNWKLYEAIWKGANAENCDMIYTPKDVTSCHIFPWQSRPMSLDFDKVEL